MPATTSTARKPAALVAAGAAGQPLDAKKKSKPKSVTGDLKRALDLMVYGREEGDEAGKALTWQQAAAEVGMTSRNMRLALEKGHVRQYLLEQKQVFRAAAGAQNISRLVAIRDQDENKMAALQAVKLLEESATPGGDDAPVRTPGISIQIVQVAGPDSQSGAKRVQAIDITRDGSE